MKKTKLNSRQLTTMAAILGLSNAGQDHLFRGSLAQVTPEDVTKFYVGRSFGDGVEEAVIRFGGGLFENEEMLAMFVDEAKSWVKTLRPMTVEKIATTWNYYAPFLKAIDAIG